jgi:hypothetical protein
MAFAFKGKSKNSAAEMYVSEESKGPIMHKYL